MTVLTGAAVGGLWSDVAVPLVLGRLGGANDPTWGALGTAGGVNVWRFSAAAWNELYFSLQLPHGYQEGTVIKPHLHWCPIDANAGNVRWGLEYQFANVNEAFGASAASESAFAAPGVAWKQSIAAWSNISLTTSSPGVAPRKSAVMLGRVYRNGAHAADTYGSVACALSFDLHIQHLGYGSVAEYPS